MADDLSVETGRAGDDRSEQPGGLFLVGTDGTSTVRYQPPAQGVVRIGSSPESDLVLSAVGVSREHALLTASRHGLVIEDRGSRNGTRVDGHRVQRAVLQVGSRLEVGSFCFEVSRFDRADVDLAIRIPAASTTPQLGVTAGAPSTVSMFLAGQERFQPLQATLEVAVANAPGAGEVLTAIREVLHADAVGLVGWRRATPVVRAAVGEVGEAPALLDVLASAEIEGACSAEGVWTSDFADPVNARLVSRRGAQPEEVESLVVWGGDGETALLRCCGLIALLTSPRGVKAPSQSGGAKMLDFPSGFVPGTAPRMLAVYDQLKSLVASELPVVFTGESGVGKERFVELLHRSSRRRSGPFVPVNCSAIPGELLEAELFGVERGAATGVEPRKGLFREADGGTLFLDEVAEMPLALQPKLLRALQERVVTPLGGRPVSFDARIVSATNVDILRAVEEERLRADLYYRLAGSVVQIPALRQRRQDVPALVEHFLLEASRSQPEVCGGGVTLRALELLTRYRWPGNVRQLANEVQRLAHVVGHDGVIDSALLSAEIRGEVSLGELDDVEGRDDLTLAPCLEAVERRLLTEALRRTEGNQSEAARLLGISRNGLALKLRRHRDAGSGLDG